MISLNFLKVTSGDRGEQDYIHLWERQKLNNTGRKLWERSTTVECEPNPACNAQGHSVPECVFICQTAVTIKNLSSFQRKGLSFPRHLVTSIMINDPDVLKETTRQTCCELLPRYFYSLLWKYKFFPDWQFNANNVQTPNVINQKYEMRGILELISLNPQLDHFLGYRNLIMYALEA